VLDGLLAREAARRSSVDGTVRRLLYPAAVFGIGALVAFLWVDDLRGRLVSLAPRNQESDLLAAARELSPALAMRWPTLLGFLAAGGGALGLLLLQGRRRRVPLLGDWIERASARPGRGLLPLDRAELVCRALGAASAAGLPLDRALERAADAGGRGRGGRALHAAAEEARRGAPPERVFSAALLPRRVVLRLAAASRGSGETFGAAAEGMAEECGRLRRDRAALLAAALHPATLLLGGAMAVVLFGSLLATWYRLALAPVGIR